MKKKGFATTGILYTLLLLFVGLLFGVLQNLQNKKTILDNLKMDTVNALACDCDTILSKLDNIENKVSSGGGAELEILKSLGNAKAEDIREGKTAVVKGELITGTMKEKQLKTQTVSISTSSDSYVTFTFDELTEVIGITAGDTSDFHTDTTSVFQLSSHHPMTIENNTVTIKLLTWNTGYTRTYSLTAIGY